MKLVKKHKNDFDSLFKEVKWDDFFQFSWEEVYYLIKKMPVTDDFKLGWGNVKKDELYKLLVDKHDFSEQRVNSTLQKINNGTAKKQQKSLSDF